MKQEKTRTRTQREKQESNKILLQRKNRKKSMTRKCTQDWC
jgi:hypothetical protein